MSLLPIVRHKLRADDLLVYCVSVTTNLFLACLSRFGFSIQYTVNVMKGDDNVTVVYKIIIRFHNPQQILVGCFVYYLVVRLAVFTHYLVLSLTAMRTALSRWMYLHLVCFQIISVTDYIFKKIIYICHLLC